MPLFLLLLLIIVIITAVLFTVFISYHLFKYGIEGDKTKIMFTLLVAGVLALIYFSFISFRNIPFEKLPKFPLPTIPDIKDLKIQKP